MTADGSVQPRRSLIFTPGNRPDMFPKALRTGADIVTGIEVGDAHGGRAARHFFFGGGTRLRACSRMPFIDFAF